jgi:hypothetical protein
VVEEELELALDSLLNSNLKTLAVTVSREARWRHVKHVLATLSDQSSERESGVMALVWRRGSGEGEGVV